MSELRSLIDAVQCVRRRLFLNAWLARSARWASFLLLGLLLGAALSPAPTWLMVAAVVLGAVAILATAWRSRFQLPDLYGAAARLDDAAQLKGRLSTARRACWAW